MASSFRRKDSSFYWIRFRRADDSWGSRSTGLRVDDKLAARRLRYMVAEETAQESLAQNDGPSALFARWVPQYLESYTNLMTRRCYKLMWSAVSLFLSERKIVHPSEVTYRLLIDYLAWRCDRKLAESSGRKPVSRNTARTELSKFGSVMQEAVRRGWVLHNPCRQMRLKAEPVARPKRAITRAEELVIVAELENPRWGDWMKEAFMVAMRQGCRMREVEVPLAWIDTKAMTIRFKIKGNRSHVAPLHKDLLPLVVKAGAEKREVLVKIPPGASNRFREMFAVVGMNDLCFHCTRVTVVTRLCEAGFSETQTMAYVGHSSKAVHEIYQKLRPVAVAALGDVL